MVLNAKEFGRKYRRFQKSERGPRIIMRKGSYERVERGEVFIHMRRELMTEDVMVWTIAPPSPDDTAVEPCSCELTLVLGTHFQFDMGEAIRMEERKKQGPELPR